MCTSVYNQTNDFKIAVYLSFHSFEFMSAGLTHYSADAPTVPAPTVPAPNYFTKGRKAHQNLTGGSD